MDAVGGRGSGKVGCWLRRRSWYEGDRGEMMRRRRRGRRRIRDFRHSSQFARKVISFITSQNNE